MTQVPDSSVGGTAGEATPVAWEDPPRAGAGGAADAAPVLSVDGFVGPLDWLPELVRSQKIDLARLSIAALIDGFAMALEAALERQETPRRCRAGATGW